MLSLISHPSLSSLTKTTAKDQEETRPNSDVDSLKENDNDHGLHQARTKTSALAVHDQVQSKWPFFHGHLRQTRRLIFTQHAIVCALMAALMLGIFSIYWGSMFHKTDHQRYLKMLVLIEDYETIDLIPPVFGNKLVEVLSTAEAKRIGEWHIYTPGNFLAIQPKDTNSTSQTVETLIHEQKFWAAIHVQANATHNFYQAMMAGNSSYVAGNETWHLVYETGRDFVNIPSYVVKNCQAIQGMMLADQQSITESLLDAVQDKGDDIDTIVQRGWKLLSQPLTFTVRDLRPVTDGTLLAPAQVGLIYMILVTFFLFAMFQDLHVTVSKSALMPKHYVLYRIMSSILSYFWLSLMYSLVSLAFQIDFGRAFGRAGFVVYWMTNWMAMTALGTINEVLAHFIVLVYPSVLGFWLVFWVMANVSPTFTPMALTANFYRYGYAMPLYNTVEITKCIFFDTYRGHMGRCFGILAAWIVVSNIALALVIPFFGKTMAKRAAKAAQAAADKQTRDA